MLTTGCASYTKKPVIEVVQIESTRPPLPDSLTNEISMPELPIGALKNEDLIMLISEYINVLAQANIDRKLTREYCGND